MKTRRAAAKVIASLLRQQGSLSSLLPEALGQVPERDRPLLQELCYGTCRWQPKLQCYLELLLDKPLRSKDLDVHALLLVGLYQMAYLRIPDHASINATVNASQALKKPWAKGLVNGVLRRFQREREALDAKLATRSEFNSAHPSWMETAIRAAYPAEAEAIFAANNAHPPFTLRVNRRQCSREEYLQQLAGAGLEARATPYSSDGITLARAADVSSLPLFAGGAVSVQDEAAQLCAPLLALAAGQRVLDACCAPGGKTAHILEYEAALERLVAVDVSEQRLQRTRENLDRLQLDAELIAADASQAPTWWQGPRFDRILVDAPCSASGVIRRHPDIKLLRRPDEVQQLQQTQRAILQNVWSLLEPGGLLLYATCSILPAENSEQVAAFLAANADARHDAIEASWGQQQEYGRQLLPQSDAHDGFYYALLRKAK